MAADEVLASKQYLSSIGHWPKIPLRANPERWLQGFEEADQDHAVAVLEALVFFSQEQTTKMFTSAFHSLSPEISSSGVSYSDKKQLWCDFLESSFVSFPTGESPSPTDSGHTFARLARQELEYEENRVLAPGEILALVQAGHRAPIVFVDDFAGSGDQFIKTWRRAYTMPNGSTMSFATSAGSANLDCYYLPVVATSYAYKRIEREAPGVKVRTAHILTPEYSATDVASIVFPEALRPSSLDFIHRASLKAGIPAHAELGFGRLALAIAFEHSVPDATLPILWADTPTWNSLLRRS